MKPSKRFPRRWLRRLVAPLLCLGSAAALAGAPRDRLTMLVPDGTNLGAWQAKVWIDSAADEGIRLDVITDSQLLAMKADAASRIAGLIVPDSAHINASQAVIDAVKQYANLGGKLMLVYDAGAKTETDFFPLTGNSRFADLVGVDYVLVNRPGMTTQDSINSMVGFGQVLGTRARMDSLSLPPGKYLPYAPPQSLAMTTNTTAFVPASRLDPGGTGVMADLFAKRGLRGIDDGSSDVRARRQRAMREVLGLSFEDSGPLRFGKRDQKASRSRDMHWSDRPGRTVDDVAALLGSDGASSTEVDAQSALAADSTLQVISGYAFGPLNYFSYLTADLPSGTFPGTVYLSSPEHGLVAGSRGYGSGQVLFVNMPLGYFKALGTDSAPLQGFLNLFARETVGIATQSVQPRGVGGLVYNWHVDDGNDLKVDTRFLLDKTDVLKSGPYSIHFTAGPDVITFGDGDGMNLANDKTSQKLVKKLAKVRKGSSSSSNDDDDDDDDDDKKYKADKSASPHALGSHGGWIHDFWGANADKLSEAVMTPLLQWNFDAIEAVTGQKIREYSSPVGNTPTWAVNWLERRGVAAMYLVGDVGAGMVRSWRATKTTIPVDASRLTTKMWTSPVTPQGRYATWEEFAEFGITDATSGQWLLDLQSFVVNHRANRMFYNHPPGAAAHLKPINALLTRASKLDSQRRFAWYTMTDLADFSQRRVETTWRTSTDSSGRLNFYASHPVSLQDMTWLLPKTRFNKPEVVSGQGSIGTDTRYWVVTADGGASVQFRATER